jgi:hypothetical protein
MAEDRPEGVSVSAAYSKTDSSLSGSSGSNERFMGHCPVCLTLVDVTLKALETLRESKTCSCRLMRVHADDDMITISGITETLEALQQRDPATISIAEQQSLTKLRVWWQNIQQRQKADNRIFSSSIAVMEQNKKFESSAEETPKRVMEKPTFQPRHFIILDT